MPVFLMNDECNEERFKPLLCCPCGKTPTDIIVTSSGQGYKYALAVPNCCGEWMIEFRTVAYDLDSDDTKRAAIDAWNSAPRTT